MEKELEAYVKALRTLRAVLKDLRDDMTENLERFEDVIENVNEII